MATLEAHGITDYMHQARKVDPFSSLNSPRALLTLPSLSNHRPKRQLRPSDFDNFDYIFAMDRSNLSDIQRVKRTHKPDSKARVMLFGEYSGTGKVEVVNDPYYGGQDGFEKAYEQAARFSRNFLGEVFGGEKA
jgi:low molecular weight phosphotyrosine protein phosphatase